MTTQYDRYCKGEFAEIKQTLAKIDESLRGNGKPGILVRVDRLEQARKRWDRWWFLVIGAVVPVLAAAAWRYLVGV